MGNDVHPSQTRLKPRCYTQSMSSRLHRYYGAGHSHFITTSCHDRLPFLGSAQSRDLFVEVLERVRRRYHFVVAGYVVMPEHVHLLLSEPDRGNPSVIMQSIKQGFARRLLSGMRRQQGCQQTPLWSEAVKRGRIWQPRFYDFRGVLGPETSGEVAIHASESGKAGFGSGARTMDMEQLSTLRLRRSWSGRGERTATSGDDGEKNLVILEPVVPSLRKPRRLGQPLWWWCYRRSTKVSQLRMHYTPTQQPNWGSSAAFRWDRARSCWFRPAP